MHKTVALLLFATLRGAYDTGFRCSNGKDILCMDCNTSTSRCNLCSISYPDPKHGNCRMPSINIEKCDSYVSHNMCKNCELGYAADTHGKCYPTTTANSTCLSAVNGLCYFCADPQYYPDEKGNCGTKACPIANCLRCNPTATCDECMADYTLTEDGCVSSDLADVYQNCMIAADNISCQRCIKGYYVNNGECENISNYYSATSTSKTKSIHSSDNSAPINNDHAGTLAL